MYYFWNDIHFKTEKVFCLNITFYRFRKKYMNRSHKYSFIYLLISLSLDHLLFLYTIVFHFLLPCNTINHVARRKRQISYVQYILFLFLFQISRCHYRNSPVSKQIDVSSPSI